MYICAIYSYKCDQSEKTVNQVLMIFGAIAKTVTRPVFVHVIIGSIQFRVETSLSALSPETVLKFILATRRRDTISIRRPVFNDPKGFCDWRFGTKFKEVVKYPSKMRSKTFFK